MTERMRARRLSKNDIGRAVQLREEHGWSIARIAREIGCSTSGVGYHFLKLGVVCAKTGLRPVCRRPRSYQRAGRSVRPFTPDEDAWLLALETEGLSYAEIGRQLNRRHNTVIARLRTLARRAEARSEAA